MGLTIHWDLKAKGTIDDAHDLLSSLRKQALDLPFQHVGEVVWLEGDKADYNKCPRNAEMSWMLIQAGAWVEVGKDCFKVPPKHLVAFSTLPGDGCEQANFGLALYPKTVKMGGKTFKTGLNGWNWQSFCKTQYASNPQCGGIANFLRCHLSVVKLLDHAKELGILKKVHDEGEYWTNRDPKALVSTVGNWNNFIAGFAGTLKDAFGDKLTAEITKFPDFERLEAKGREGQD